MWPFPKVRKAIASTSMSQLVQVYLGMGCTKDESHRGIWAPESFIENNVTETHDVILIVDAPYHMHEVTLINYRRCCTDLKKVHHMPKTYLV